MNMETKLYLSFTKTNKINVVHKTESDFSMNFESDLMQSNGKNPKRSSFNLPLEQTNRP